MGRLLQLDHTYYEDEVRDGFYVPTLMKRFWAAQMEVLAEIDRICRKYDIEYFAEWGTLLGAIRHHGMVPWDDDMDICMKRDQYNRFYRVCKQELSEEFEFFSTIDTDDDDNMIVRIVNGISICYEKDYLEKFHDMPYIAGVDIFVLDYLPMDQDEDKLQEYMYFQALGVAGLYDPKDTEIGDHADYIHLIEEQFGVQIHEGFSIKRQLFNIAERVAAMYTAEDSDYLTIMHKWNDVSGKGAGKRYKLPKEYYDRSIPVLYEGIMTIPVPYFYDAILRFKYGNYMQLVKNGSSHDYPIFLKQEDLVKKNSEYDFYKTYVYSKEDAAPIVKQESAFLASVRENVSLWSEVYEEALRLHTEGAEEALFDLLGQWQEMVISLGDQIEKNCACYDSFISVLEELCECFYTISTCEGAERDGNFARIRELISAAHVGELKEIETEVYIVYKAAQWPLIRPMWEKSMADATKRVYVVAIPYFEKDAFGNAKENMYYEGMEFPEDVTVVDFTTVDLQQVHPRRIITQYGYDNYNVGITTFIPFFTESLKNCCDELIYVPPFTPDAFTKADGRYWYQARYFISIPGVATASHTVVDNDALRRSYIDYLSAWAGEDTRDIWEEKIVVAAEDEKLHPKTMEELWEEAPSSWREARKDQTILFQISGSSLIRHEKKAIQKLHSNMEVWKAHKEEIAVLWIEDPYLDMMLSVEEYADLYKEYREAVFAFVEDGLGIYAKEEELLVPVERMVDGFYGDAGVLMHKAQEAKCPIMLENFDI